MIEALQELLARGWTPGAVGVWALLAAFLIAWWKGLPAVIEAMANRQSKIEERLGAEMDAMSARWEARLEAADKQHQECIAGQDALRDRITKQDATIALQNDTIAQQTKTITDLNERITGLKLSNEQLQISLAERRLGDGEESGIDKALDKLRKMQ